MDTVCVCQIQFRFVECVKKKECIGVKMRTVHDSIVIIVFRCETVHGGTSGVAHTDSVGSCFQSLQLDV